MTVICKARTNWRRHETGITYFHIEITRIAHQCGWNFDMESYKDRASNDAGKSA